MEIQLLLLFGIMDLPDCFCLNSGYLVFERGKLKTEICQIFGDSVDMLKQIEMISIGLLHPMCCEGETLMHLFI